MREKKSRLGAFQDRVSVKLTHIHTVASGLQAEISDFYDSTEFYITKDIPCLSDDFVEYGQALEDIRNRCDFINKKIEEEIKTCKAKYQ